MAQNIIRAFTPSGWRTKAKIFILDSALLYEYPYDIMLNMGPENLILRSVVDELQLSTHPLPDGEKTVSWPSAETLVISESVQPKWRFDQDAKWFQKFQFGIVEALPSNVSMILGDEALGEMELYRVNRDTWFLRKSAG